MKLVEEKRKIEKKLDEICIERYVMLWHYIVEGRTDKTKSCEMFAHVSFVLQKIVQKVVRDWQIHHF